MDVRKGSQSIPPASGLGWGALSLRRGGAGEGCPFPLEALGRGSHTAGLGDLSQGPPTSPGVLRC